MSKPKLVYSPVQLHMANQYRIFPIARLEDVEVSLAGVTIAGVTIAVDFEVIESWMRRILIPLC